MDYQVGEQITIETLAGEEANVLVIDVRAKSVKVKGNISQAWFPKAAINDEGVVAKWFRLTMSHCFLWDTPYDETKIAAH